MLLSLIGWFGTFVYLINHAYLSYAKSPNKSAYYMANLLAALSLVTTSALLSSYQAVIINGFWALISILMFREVSLTKIPFNTTHYFIFLGGLITLLAAALMFFPPLLTDILGWMSAYIFSASYLLYNIKKFSLAFYMWSNMIAALLIVPTLYLDMNYPVLVLEVLWAGISLYGALKHSDIQLID